jgi:hypothetical protein
MAWFMDIDGRGLGLDVGDVGLGPWVGMGQVEGRDNVYDGLEEDYP